MKKDVYKRQQYNSSIYLAINDKEGQMVYSVVNTDIVSLINKEYISTIIDTINTFDYVLIDTNLDSDTIDYLFEKVNKPIICDAVSTITVSYTHLLHVEHVVN